MFPAWNRRPTRSRRLPQFRHFVPLGLALAALSGPASARSTTTTFSGRWDDIASGGGNLVYLAAGLGLPFLQDGKDGKRHALRVLDAGITGGVISVGLKALTHEKRPDADSHDSFPSGHATAAFAVAAMESEYHPKQAVWWYLGATAIAASRVTLHRHYVHDVVAGAALGYGTARWEVSRPRGLLLSPFIARDGGGLTISRTF